MQAAEAQLSAARAKADADASTSDKLKRPSPTAGVFVGNHLVLAQKAVETNQSQITAAQQAMEASYKGTGCAPSYHSPKRMSRACRTGRL